MAQYLLSIYQPDGPPPEPHVLAAVTQDLGVLNEELRRAGAWVFTAGLHAADVATTVRVSGGDVLITDGPYVEGKEHIGGIWVIDVPDLDDALGWARKASAATTLPIEVRPFHDVAAYRRARPAGSSPPPATAPSTD